MSTYKYLERLFKAYYKENRNEIDLISKLRRREFGFSPWDSKFKMIRHIDFKDHEELIKYFIENAPRHIYFSSSLYSQPAYPDMEFKGYQGCDLIFDIDVDHFYTSCKEDHDIWYCKECGRTGKGMIKKCPKCGKMKFKTLNWICDECLESAKNEILKLIYDFLDPDFGIEISKIKITFSGHRGYHLKIEDENLKSLSSDDRREIADFVSGSNISLYNLGLRKLNEVIYGIKKEDIGWPQKIIKKIEGILTSYSNDEINRLLTAFGLKTNAIKSFINDRDYFLKKISKSSNNNIWDIRNFGLKSWQMFLFGIIGEIGVRIDEPVTIDIHRLIRYPSSLHGKTGFKVQELYPDNIDLFTPLDEVNKDLDPIVFKSEKKITQKIEIIEPEVPTTKIKGDSWGPYKGGEIIEVPHHIAVFLLCKGVAKTI